MKKKLKVSWQRTFNVVTRVKLGKMGSFKLDLNKVLLTKEIYSFVSVSFEVCSLISNYLLLITKDRSPHHS